MYSQTSKLSSKQALINLAADLSFTHFARNTQDLRRCPTTDCQYWGYMPVTELSKCQRALVCPTCEHSWFEQCQKRGSELPYKGLASNLRQLLISNPCPNCGLKIQKDYGCQHMGCAKCQFEFCWWCLTQYTSYNHTYPAACFVISVSKTSIYATLVLMLLYKFHIVQTFWWLAKWAFGLLWWCLYIPFTFVVAGLYICLVNQQINALGPRSYPGKLKPIYMVLLILNLTLFTYLSTKW